MDLIKDIYESFDALPAIDKEYDHPVVRAAVQQLIAHELSASAESVNNDVDEFLAQRFPNLWTCAQIDEVAKKFEHAGSVTNKKLKAWEFPTAPAANDVEAWKNTVSAAKVCYLHQENQLLNLELAEERDVKPAFLAHNAALEEISLFYEKERDRANARIHETQQVRVNVQERFFPQLNKYRVRRDEALQRKVHCETAFRQLQAHLAMRGFDYQEHLRELERLEEEERLRRLQDASVNSTVREYENVRVEDAESDDENQAGKKQRTT